MNKFTRLMCGASRLCMEGENGDQGAAGGAATTGGDQGAGVSSGVAWLDKPTAEDLAYVQSKGWDKSANPAKDILQSYRHLEKMNGAVAGGKAVLLPDENADEATRNAFFEKIGRPQTVDGYEIKEPWKGMSPELGTELNALAHKLGLTKAQAQGLYEWNNTTTDAVAKSFEDDFKIENAQQVTALKNEWGGAYDQNLAVATEAAKKFGVSPEQITQLQQVMGYDGVMKFMNNIGKGVGEASFIGSGDGGGRGASDNTMTPAQAQAELSRLANDPVFTKAWLTKEDVGHKAAVEKKSQLSKWAYPPK